jgi:aspartate dehydrogenase
MDGGERGEMRVGLVGFGAMARALVRCLDANGGPGRLSIVSALVQPGDVPLNGIACMAHTVFTTDSAEFWNRSPELVVECAGHSAVRNFCPEVLHRGHDLILISIGALADAQVEATLREAAAKSASRLFLPAGAVGGVDFLASARLAGLERVRYASRKPPRAWKGTRAEQTVNLDELTEAVEFFQGNAREAALQYPQNANVAAAIALAGIGFEKTEVTLKADPSASVNEHYVVAEGGFGRAESRVAARPLPDNPKTSWLGALSLARAVLNASARVVI